MLRDATVDDLTFVHGLYMHESINPFVGYDPMPLATFEPIFLDLLEGVEFLIYEPAGEPVGMLQIQRGIYRFRHSVHLGGIAVSPPLQHQGLGSAMMRELLTRLRAERILRIELTVSDDNPRGIAFYQKLGFVREGTMKQYFSRAGRDGYFDEHLMALLLT